MCNITPQCGTSLVGFNLFINISKRFWSQTSVIYLISYVRLFSTFTAEQMVLNKTKVAVCYDRLDIVMTQTRNTEQGKILYTFTVRYTFRHVFCIYNFLLNMYVCNDNEKSHFLPQQQQIFLMSCFARTLPKLWSDNIIAASTTTRTLWIE